MTKIMNWIKNNFLVIGSVILLIIFIWLRILAERLPKEIPFNLSTVSIIIIICIIFGHIATINGLSNYTKMVWENKYAFKFSILDLNRIIDIIIEAYFKFRRKIYDKNLTSYPKFLFDFLEERPDLVFLYQFLKTKIIPNKFNKTKYNYVINYIRIEVFLRALLSLIFITDIFYFNMLYYYYTILILLSIFLVVHLFIKNMLKAVVNNFRTINKNKLKIIKKIPVNALGHDDAVNFETGHFGFLTLDYIFIPYPTIDFEDLIELQTRQHLKRQPLIQYILLNVNRPGIDLSVAESMLDFAILCHAAYIHIEIRKRHYIYWLIALHLIQVLCWTYILIYNSYNISGNLFILSIVPECFDINLFI